MISGLPVDGKILCVVFGMPAPDSQLIAGVLLAGAIGALVLIIIAFLLSRFVRDVVGRSLPVISLLLAAGAYFGFATLGRDLLGTGAIWMMVELLQVMVFGAIALLGLRGSPYWLAAGWALHPVWDFVLHYVGPGRPFTPWTYAIACISFDLMVAVYIVFAYRVIGPRRLGFRDAAA